MQKKYKLRPWVKVALAFILGVALTAKIFDIATSDASDELENKIFHGVISMNVNGESHIKHIDGAWEHDIVLETKDGYKPLEIVTVVLEGDRVVNDYLTKGDELRSLEDNYQLVINEYRSNIIDSIYE